MEQEILRKFEAQCIQEEAPACQSICPLHVDARSFIKFMAEDKKDKARQVLDKSLPLSMLTAFLCEGACQEACIRSKIDQGINLPQLEKACVLTTKSAKIMPFPSTGRSIALIGSGLSSFVLAFELAKKGHRINLYFYEEIGKDILEKTKSFLPQNAFSDCLTTLKNLKVNFSPLEVCTIDFLENLLQDFSLVYLSLDDNFVLNSELIKSLTVNPLTLVSSNPKVLLGGSKNLTSFIQSIAEGKKAALSIERIFQDVDPSIAREKEASYETRLYTNIDDIAVIKPVDFQDRNKPSMEEAILEAKRCIQCSCLECVKQCSYLANYKSYPKRYLREVYNNLSVVQGIRQANGLINACTQCGLCEKVCPQGLNMGEYLAIARKEMVDTKRMPPSAHEFALDDMAFSNSELIQFIRKDHKEINKYIFFPGCQLPTVLAKNVSMAYAYLRENLSDGVGFHLGCCGMPANWAGQSKFLDKSLEEFKQNWESLGRPIYIFACASCSDFYKTFFPELEQISLWEILEKMPKPENALLPNQTLAIHDPCSSRSFAKMQSAVRSLLNSLNQSYVEFEYGQERTRCCGYGGLSASAKPEIADTFLEHRKNESEHDLLVYCAICRERYQKIGQKTLHILELLFSSEDDLENAQQIIQPLYLRQEKRLEFKKSILKEFWGEEYSMPENQINLNISNEVIEKIATRHILKEDIISVIIKANENNSALYNQDSGHFLAAYKPRLVTYWVEYAKEEDGSYTIYNAYCHRMVVPGVVNEKQAALFQEVCCNKK